MYWYGGQAAAVQPKADGWMIYVPPGAVPPVLAPSLEAAMKVAERLVAQLHVAPGERVKINAKLGSYGGQIATVTEIRGTEVQIKTDDGSEGFTDISNVERVAPGVP
jgi:preprotein translocase subunit YajC